MMLTEPSLRTFLRFLTARRTLIVAPLSRGVMSVFCNVIKPQGLEPFQFSTKISSPSWIQLDPACPIVTVRTPPRFTPVIGLTLSERSHAWQNARRGKRLVISRGAKGEAAGLGHHLVCRTSTRARLWLYGIAAASRTPCALTDSCVPFLVCHAPSSGSPSGRCVTAFFARHRWSTDSRIGPC